MSYTKGPWEWDSKPWDFDEDEEAPWLVASGRDMVEPPVITGEAIKCSEANAKLISAAPELYEALKALVSIVDKIPADLSRNLTLFEILVEANEILKKAEL